MILKVFSVFDAKTSNFGIPFFLAHTGQAIRACMDLAGDPNTIPGRYPADFMLYELGGWNDANAAFEPILPVNHGPLSAFLKGE